MCGGSNCHRSNTNYRLCALRPSSSHLNIPAVVQIKIFKNSNTSSKYHTSNLLSLTRGLNNVNFVNIGLSSGMRKVTKALWATTLFREVSNPHSREQNNRADSVKAKTSMNNRGCFLKYFAVVPIHAAPVFGEN